MGGTDGLGLEAKTEPVDILARNRDMASVPCNDGSRDDSIHVSQD